MNKVLVGDKMPEYTDEYFDKLIGERLSAAVRKNMYAPSVRARLIAAECIALNKKHKDTGWRFVTYEDTLRDNANPYLNIPAGTRFGATEIIHIDNEGTKTYLKSRNS